MLKTNMILKPLINEKSMSLIKNGMFTFEVGLSATKESVQRMVKQRFGVDVLSVKIINVKGKHKQQRTRKGSYTTSASKKAIVKVKKGQKIAIFEEAVATKEAAHDHDHEEVEVRTAEGESMGTVKEKKSLLRGTKVRIERGSKSQGVKESKEANLEAKNVQEDTKRPSKTSQKEVRKGK